VLYTLCQDYWPESAKNADEDYKKQVLTLVQERMKYLAELPELTNFFFDEPTPDLELITSNKQLKKLDNDRIKELLERSKQCLGQSNFTHEDIQERLNQLLDQTGEKPAVVFSLIRIATTWAPASPQLNTSLAVLGKQTTLSRIQKTIDLLT
ncbi:glutamate--tRNA ligase, partial [Candidatus Saccharibacteria bacterium]|nr:glutamate--tRNA ligase [Candidatus Saccharibacteria bacterium]